MKKYAYLLILVSFLMGCNGTGSSNNGSSTDILSSSSGQTSENSSAESESREPPVGMWTKSVSFYNGGFTNSSLDQKASQTQFVNWFNGDDDVLASIDYEGYAQLNYIGNANDDWRFSTLILGSQNSEGKITFNLKVRAVSVKITVQAYAKYIAYNDSYSIDRSATFLIDNEEHDLSLQEGHTGNTEQIVIVHPYIDETVTSFSISNKEAGQRVFVHSLEITHEGQ